MEQSGTVNSVDKSSLLKKKRKSKDLDTGVDGNKQSHDGSQDFEVSGGFDEDQESGDIKDTEAIQESLITMEPFGINRSRRSIAAGVTFDESETPANAQAVGN
ncbi:hypothetical protein ElyMa_000536400 [Elysia marginata]|uniref:Uncharacterized protein n=1 Tax=Elysia marginata TaxID=1093978 RepID=A0AAV4FZP6_9GAST|nr:hypothetical protein ElyMa_000536400 [Elysia marginata]